MRLQHQLAVFFATVLSVALFLSRSWLLPPQRHETSSDFCESKAYRSNVLKLVKDAPFAGLFADLKNQTKFEASGVAFDPTTSTFLTVFDSSMSIGRIDETFRFRGPDNALIGDQQHESQFEGISMYSSTSSAKSASSSRRASSASSAVSQWLLLAEAVPASPSSKEEYYPETTLVKLTAGRSDGYEVIERCLVDFRLAHENKGFESIVYVEESGMLLGLCEGNHCVGGKKGRERGNGRIVVSERTVTNDGTCVWRVVDMIEVPKVAFFQDYSAMAIHRGMGKMAILSQEDAAVALLDFDVATLRFGVEDGGEDQGEKGVVWHLPRDAHCDIVFCNAEGIAFMDEYRLLIVSDKAKSKQGEACLAHDQSAAIFVVPSGFEPYGRRKEEERYQ